MECSKDKKVYEFSHKRLDGLWGQIRSVCGETKRDIYYTGSNNPEDWEYVRDEANINIRYDNEFSLWVAIVIVDTTYIYD